MLRDSKKGLEGGDEEKSPLLSPDQSDHIMEIQRSVFDESYEFSEYTSVVTIVKTKGGLGHSILFVESLDSGTNLVSKYHIRFKPYAQQKNIFNQKGYISEILTPKTDKVSEKYIKCPSRSHMANVNKVKEMIASIRKDKKQVKKHKKYLTGQSNDPADNQPLEYQFLGASHFLTKSSNGDNCTSWILDKLKIAGIDYYDNVLKPKPDVVKPCFGCNLS